MSKFDAAILSDLADADIGLPSDLAKLALDGVDLSEKQNAIVEKALAAASTCEICGEYAGFNDEEYCQYHSDSGEE